MLRQVVRKESEGGSFADTSGGSNGQVRNNAVDTLPGRSRTGTISSTLEGGEGTTSKKSCGTGTGCGSGSRLAMGWVSVLQWAWSSWEHACLRGMEAAVERLRMRKTSKEA